MYSEMVTKTILSRVKEVFMAAISLSDHPLVQEPTW